MKKITIRSITREETNFLKGIAILLIVLHNYYKWINPITGQNEFSFSISNILKSYIFIRSNPLEFFHVFFNFLGHYGVQAFIFLSAYGLTISYHNKRPKYGSFILHRFDKLYPSFVFAALLFVVIKIIQDGGKLIGTDVLSDLGIQLSLFANFIPGKAIAVNGPWWFYSLIFQFYLVFPFFMWINRKLGSAGLLILTLLGYVFTILMYKPMDAVSLNSLEFFTGHIPEFCFGILLANRKEVKIPVWAFLLAFLVFIGGNIYQWLWPYTFISITLLFIVLFQSLLKVKHRIHLFVGIVTFIGAVSMYLFACHGFLRLNFLILANNQDSQFTALLVGLIYVAFATGIAYLMMQTERVTRQWIKAPKIKSYKYLRFLILFIIIIGSFSFLFFKERMAIKEKRQKGIVVYSNCNDFEIIDPSRTERYPDSTFYSGSRSFFMPSKESYTPAMEINFDTIKLNGIVEVEVSAMLYTNDSLSEGHIVIEVFDRPTDFRVLWRNKSFSSSSENFIMEDWFLFQFNYKLPKEYLLPNYKLRVYFWNNSKGCFFVDNMILEIKATI